MRNWTIGVSVALLSLGVALTAHADICDAHYQFEGNLLDASGNGYHGQMIAEGGVPSTPQFTAGRNGKALQLNGTNAMRAPLDLHPDNCPQVTVVAWVRIEPEPNQMIFGNDGGNWLFNSVTGIGVRSNSKDLWADGKPVRANGGWLFVAAVWDYVSQVHRIHWGTRSKEASFAGRDLPFGGESAIWIGADNDKLHRRAKDMEIDEIRFISRALSKEEISALRRDGLASAGAGQQAANQSDATNQGRVERSIDTMDRTVERSGDADDDASLTAQGGTTAEDDSAKHTLSDMQRQASARNAGVVGGVDRESPTGILPQGESADGQTLAEMQAQVAERNAGVVGGVDRESPTGILPPGENAGGQTLAEMQAQAAERNADAVGQVDSNNPRDVLPSAGSTRASAPDASDGATEPSGPGGLFGNLAVGEFLRRAIPSEAPSGDVALCKPFDQRIPALAMGFRDEVIDVAIKRGCDLIDQSVRYTMTGRQVQDPTEYRTLNFQSALLKEAYTSCLGSGPPSVGITNGLTAFWNEQIANNGWGTIGPRQLRFNERAEGNLVAPGDRKFITLHPWLSMGRPAIFELEEMGGRARVHGTICSIDPWTNHYDLVHAFSLNDTDEEKDTLQAIVQTLSSDLRFYSVDLDAKGTPLRTFEYIIRIGS